MTRDVAPGPARSFWMRTLPFFEPKPPATQSSSASRSTRAWCEAKCHVSRERFWIDTYSSFAAWPTTSSTAAFVYAGRSGDSETYSSIRREAAARPRRRRAAARRARLRAPSSRRARTAGARARRPVGTWTSSPCFQSAAFCAVELVVGPDEAAEQLVVGERRKRDPGRRPHDLDAGLARERGSGGGGARASRWGGRRCRPRRRRTRPGRSRRGR